MNAHFQGVASPTSMGSWWLRLIVEAALNIDLLDDEWSPEFIRGLEEQVGLQLDQLSE